MSVLGRVSVTHLSVLEFVGLVHLSAEEALCQSVALHKVHDRLRLVNQAALALDELVVFVRVHSAVGETRGRENTVSDVQL